MHCDSKDHSKHMCALKSQGLDDCIKALSDKPTIHCNHCGAPANSSKNVCAAHLGETAPSVEGGHGVVGLDEIGKPHAGGKKPADSKADIEMKEVAEDGFCGGY